MGGKILKYKLRSAIEAARGQYVQAGIGFNPVLQYQGEEIGDVNSAGFQSVRISQQYVTANKLGLAQQVEAQSIERQRAELRLAELQVLTNVRTAFAAALVRRMDTSTPVFTIVFIVCSKSKINRL